VKGIFDRNDVLALADPKLAADFVQATKPDDSGNGPGGLLNAPVDDEGIDLVGEWSRLAVLAVVTDFPL